MSYDIIGGGRVEDGGEDFFTIGELIDVLNEHASLPVKFIGTDYTLGNLGSWRGSYDIPSITYERGERLAGDIAHQLATELNEEHSGYKGGEYRYEDTDEFYVASYGCSDEYKVISAYVEDDVLVLVTKIDPY